jgi:hypothetical protein
MARTRPHPAPDLATFAGLPWGSVVTVHGGQTMQAISGPATYQPSGWALPVFFRFDSDAGGEEIEEQSAELRRSWGLEGRTAA